MSTSRNEPRFVLSIDVNLEEAASLLLTAERRDGYYIQKQTVTKLRAEYNRLVLEHDKWRESVFKYAKEYANLRRANAAAPDTGRKALRSANIKP
jgi:hypothetical protein